MKELTTVISVTIDGKGGYYGSVPEIGGIHATGRSVKDTTRRTAEALASYLEVSILHNDPVPHLEQELKA